MTIELKSLPLIHRGRLSANYRAGKNRLRVKNDWVTEFGVPLVEIPNIGKILNAMGAFWSRKFEIDLRIPTHLTDIHPDDLVLKEEALLVRSRSVVMKELKMIPFEFLVCGHTIYGQKMPQTTVIVSGDSIQAEPNIFALANNMSVRLYDHAYAHALSRGIVIADTKLTFGIDESGEVMPTGELFTPDSSTFWSQAEYRADMEKGVELKPFEKRPLLEWLEKADNGKPWDRKSPIPNVPARVVAEVATRYHRELAALCVTAMGR